MLMARTGAVSLQSYKQRHTKTDKRPPPPPKKKKKGETKCDEVFAFMLLPPHMMRAEETD